MDNSNGERRHEYPKLIERLARLEEQLKSSKEALDVAYKALDCRLGGMNEFRQALTDQASTFTTRTEHQIIVNEIRELREFKAELMGKASQSSVYIAWGLALLAMLLHWIK